MNLEKLVKERIEENEKLFNKEEICFINEKMETIKKIYLLALLDTKI